MNYFILCLECGAEIYDSVVSDPLIVEGLDLSDCECNYCGATNSLDKIEY